MTRVELPFPVPLSACFTNAKGRGRVPTARYEAWKQQAAWMIKTQKPKPEPIKGQVSVSVRLVAPDKRHRDAGNTDKAVLDAIVRAGLIEDDSNRYVRRVSYEWAATGAPCTVLIQPYEGGV